MRLQKIMDVTDQIVDSGFSSTELRNKAVIKSYLLTKYGSAPVDDITLCRTSIDLDIETNQQHLCFAEFTYEILEMLVNYILTSNISTNKQL